MPHTRNRQAEPPGGTACPTFGNIEVAVVAQAVPPAVLDSFTASRPRFPANKPTRLASRVHSFRLFNSPTEHHAGLLHSLRGSRRSSPGRSIDCSQVFRRRWILVLTSRLTRHPFQGC